MNTSADREKTPILETSFEAFTARVSPPLSAFVECIWAVNGVGDYNREVILPNGMIELMVNFGPPHRVVAIGKRQDWTVYKHFWIAGLQNQPLTVEALDVTNVLGIRFKPGGAHAFIPRSIDGLSNQVIEGDLLLGCAIEALRNRLEEAPTWPQRVQAAETWLMERLAPNEHDYHIVQRALCALSQPTAGLPIGALCNDLGLSNKHLITLFKRIVGLPPKTMGRILRFNSVINRVRHSTHQILWAQVAHEFNYYDQAHFIREFQYFCGISPTQYVGCRSPDGGSLIAD